MNLLNIPMINFNKIYDLLGVKIWQNNRRIILYWWNSRNVWSLEKTGRMIESENAMIVDLTPEGITPCIVKNQMVLPTARDLLLFYRTSNFDFDKCLYVIGNEQALF